MADHFEEAKDEILKRTADNGGPQSLDILTALGALAKDTDETAEKLAKKTEEQHKESLAAIASNRQVLIDHCVEADLRDTRIDALEKWRSDSAKTCVERVTAIAERVATDQHASLHAAHMAEHHPSPVRREGDSLRDDHSGERNASSEVAREVWFMWMLGTNFGKLLLVVLGGAIMIAINLIVYGRP